MPMRPGQVIISQGEEADLFYVVAEGEVEVTQSNERAGVATRRVLRRLGRRQFFGEIGLLSGVPRTATVTAVNAGKLITLEKEEFLELVSTGPGLTYSLLNLHRGTNVGVADSVPDSSAAR
jgi:CRP-like cAMP-binding protein